MLKYRPLNNGADKQAVPGNRNYTNIEKKCFSNIPNTRKYLTRIFIVIFKSNFGVNIEYFRNENLDTVFSKFIKIL